MPWAWVESTFVSFIGQHFCQLPLILHPSKDPDAGKDSGQEKKGVTEDEMVGWHHPLNGHEYEQTLEDSEGQGSQACCRSWGRKESDTTE